MSTHIYGVNDKGKEGGLVLQEMSTWSMAWVVWGVREDRHNRRICLPGNCYIGSEGG